MTHLAVAPQFRAGRACLSVALALTVLAGCGQGSTPASSPAGTAAADSASATRKAVPMLGSYTQTFPTTTQFTRDWNAVMPADLRIGRWRTKSNAGPLDQTSPKQGFVIALQDGGGRRFGFHPQASMASLFMVEGAMDQATFARTYESLVRSFLGDRESDLPVHGIVGPVVFEGATIFHDGMKFSCSEQRAGLANENTRTCRVESYLRRSGTATNIAACKAQLEGNPTQDGFGEYSDCLQWPR